MAKTTRPTGSMKHAQSAFSITSDDDGTPTECIKSDLKRSLRLFDDERYLIANELYCDALNRLELKIKAHDCQVNAKPRGRFSMCSTTPTAKPPPPDIMDIENLLRQRASSFNEMRQLSSIFQSARTNLTISSDWKLCQTVFGITTYYRRELDNTLSVKIEGEVHGVPLFEQLAVLREGDLYHEWAPFCHGSRVLKKIGRTDYVNWFKTNCGFIERDCVYRAIGCDCMMEEGSILLVAEGLKCDDNDCKKGGYLSEVEWDFDLPPVPKGFNAGRMHINTFQGRIEVLGVDSARTRLVANIDPNLKFIPQSFIDFAMKKMCGVLLQRLQSQATKIVRDPLNNPHAIRIREDNDFYVKWLKVKFRDHCYKQGWEMPQIPALMLIDIQDEYKPNSERFSATTNVSVVTSNSAPTMSQSSSKVSFMKKIKLKKLNKQMEIIKQQRRIEAMRQRPKQLSAREIQRFRHLHKLKSLKKMTLPSGGIIRLHPLLLSTVIFLCLLAFDGPLYRYTVSLSHSRKKVGSTFLYLAVHSYLFCYLMRISLLHGFDIIQQSLSEGPLTEGKKCCSANIRKVSVYFSIIMQAVIVLFVELNRLLHPHLGKWALKNIKDNLDVSSSYEIIMQISRRCLAYSGGFVVLAVSFLHLFIVKKPVTKPKTSDVISDGRPAPIARHATYPPSLTQYSNHDQNDSTVPPSRISDVSGHSDISLISYPQNLPRSRSLGTASIKSSSSHSRRGSGNLRRGNGIFCRRRPLTASQLAKKYDVKRCGTYQISYPFHMTRNRKMNRWVKEMTSTSYFFLVMDMIAILALITLVYPTFSVEGVSRKIYLSAYWVSDNIGLFKKPFIMCHELFTMVLV